MDCGSGTLTTQGDRFAGYMFSELDQYDKGLAAGRGVEPLLRVPKTLVLPLDDPAILRVSQSTH